MTRSGHEVLLVRHGETEWSRDGRHTGSSDLPLTDAGHEVARRLGDKLRSRHFELVLSSPLSRAVETARLAGFEDPEIRDELREWDYGEYEGLTTAEIRERHPGWRLWRDGCPDGEDAAGVGARADRVVADLRGVDGNAIVFSHGHFLRVLGARWAGLAPEHGAAIGLETATLSTLGWEREAAVIWEWNAP